MSLSQLVRRVTKPNYFNNLQAYYDFCASYLEYIEQGLQARIVSQNENHYQFFQYGRDGHYNVTRPINTSLFCSAGNFSNKLELFKNVLSMLRDRERPHDDTANAFREVIYTLQQSIAVTLDALSTGKSNQARKRNGDIFETLIRLLIQELNVICESKVVQLPIKDEHGNQLLTMSFQHDLVVKRENEVKLIGSVKTSSKDRIDKIFIDKLLFNRMSGCSIPHIAIFLNDVQRKKSKKDNQYGINATFLAGHFKAYSIRLTPLDGVYYCDIRPNMVSDEVLSSHIRTIDKLFFDELWHWID
jgi:hypothetical protein